MFLGSWKNISALYGTVYAVLIMFILAGIFIGIKFGRSGLIAYITCLFFAMMFFLLYWLITVIFVAIKVVLNKNNKENKFLDKN